MFCFFFTKIGADSIDSLVQQRKGGVRTLRIPLWCKALAVKKGASLSCLRRERRKKTNLWIHLDLPDVIVCKEKYMENSKYRPIAISSSTSHRKAISKGIP